MADASAPVVRPLVVCGPDGRPIGILEENEKGYRKTIERSRLWALHPGTGRLLPFYEESPATIAERDGWYEAVLGELPGDAPSGSGDAGSHDAGSGSRAGASPSRPDETAAAERDPADPPRPGEPADPLCDAADPGTAADRRPAIGTVLEELARVIASRHVEMPEGSYTTHLFESGAEKIRKKAGEEAIELVLAATRETIVSESADLVYHLLVLLESEGIPLGDLAAELDRR